MNQTQSNLGWTTRKVKGKSGRIRVSPLYIFFFWFALYACLFSWLVCILHFPAVCIFFVTAFFHKDPPPYLGKYLFLLFEILNDFQWKKKLKSSVMRLRWLSSHSLQIKANQISPEKQNNGWYYRNFLGSGINKKWPYLYVIMTPKFTDHYYC